MTGREGLRFQKMKAKLETELLAVTLYISGKFSYSSMGLCATVS